MIFLDMDGVLAIYNPADYRGDPMPFEIPQTRYFLHRPVDQSAVKLLQDLQDTFSAENVVVLTTLSKNALANPALCQEHRTDKTLWLDSVCKHANIPTPRLLFAKQEQVSKPQIATRTLNRELQISDILIDDFNSNLYAWSKAGGTAVKWINQHNSADSWPNLYIDARSSA